MKPVLLRDMEQGDLEQVLLWRNSLRVRATMFSDLMITMEEHYRWFQQLKDSDNKIYKIFEYDNKKAGLVCFVDIDRVNSTCFWGFYLGETELPPQTGSTMGFLALQYIFEKVNIRKVYGDVLGDNDRSLRYHLRLGFKEERRFLEHILKNGQYHDVVRFGQFKSYWFKHKNGLSVVLFEEDKICT